MNEQYDIAIVGLGPTGAVLANILGQYGWSVIGIDREEDIYYAPKAVHFDDEIMRIFQSIGLADEISKTSEAFKEMEFMLNFSGKPAAKGLVGSQDARYGYNGAFWFHQPTLEKHFRDGLTRFQNVTTLYGYEVIDIEQNENQVSLSIKDSKEPLSAKNTHTESTIHAKYLVGCDGGRSFVRKKANLNLETADFDEPWIVVDTKLRNVLKDPELPKNHRQYCNPKQPVTYVPLAGPYYEWQFMVVDGKSEKEATDPFYVRQLLKPFVDLDKIEINRIAYYKFHALWATKWRNNRIIIAGDAAHQMPPFLGQGMCSGIRDASLLGWRLDMILKGIAHDTLIDSYEKERYAHVKHIINGAMLLGSIIQTTKKWKAVLRNAFIFKPLALSSTFRKWFTQKANRKMPLETGLIGKNCKSLAGHLAIQPLINVEGKDILLDELLGDGFSIISKSGSDYQIFQMDDFRISQKDGHLNKPSLIFQSAALQTWFSENNIEFVMIRPDRYVYDAGKITDIQRILDNFREQFAFAKPLNQEVMI